MRFPCWLLILSAIVASSVEAADALSTLRPGHPRLLVAPGAFEAMRQAERDDPLRAKLHRQISAQAEAQQREAPIAHVLVGPRLLGESRKALAHVMANAVAFRLTGERRYFEHARGVMLTAAAFPDWNPAHFLDVAEMATALAIGYDWLFAELSAADRATVARALKEKALAFAKPAYARADPERVSFPFVKGNLTNNWNQVCNGGFLLSALALAEEEPALARDVIAGLRETLPLALAAYEPDGAYPEGPVYWGYGTRYTILIVAALESALGQDFGLGTLSAFDRTALYRLCVESPTGLFFNYADGRPEAGVDSGVTWLAQRHGPRAALALNRARLESLVARAPDPSDRFFALHAIWFPTAPATLATEPLPLNRRFRGDAEIVIFRTAWDDPAALWCGLKAGSNRVNHGHLDLGSFVLDADGERWACDLGPDDYNLPGYWEGQTTSSRRWAYYRLNNFSHNTVTPGQALQYPNARAEIVAWSGGPRPFAVVDLSAAYPESAKSFRRGLAVLGGQRALVQDEVRRLRAGTPLTWRMLTAAHVATDGARATLSRGDRHLRVHVVAPVDAVFASRPAIPPTAAENPNEGITELFLMVPAADAEADVTIAVVFTPERHAASAGSLPALAPLAEWK